MPKDKDKYWLYNEMKLKSKKYVITHVKSGLKNSLNNYDNGNTHVISGIIIFNFIIYVLPVDVVSMSDRYDVEVFDKDINETLIELVAVMKILCSYHKDIYCIVPNGIFFEINNYNEISKIYRINQNIIYKNIENIKFFEKKNSKDRYKAIKISENDQVCIYEQCVTYFNNFMQNLGCLQELGTENKTVKICDIELSQNQFVNLLESINDFICGNTVTTSNENVQAIIDKIRGKFWEIDRQIVNNQNQLKVKDERTIKKSRQEKLWRRITSNLIIIIIILMLLFNAPCFEYLDLPIRFFENYGKNIWNDYIDRTFKEFDYETNQKFTKTCVFSNGELMQDNATGENVSRLLSSVLVDLDGDSEEEMVAVYSEEGRNGENELRIEVFTGSKDGIKSVKVGSDSNRKYISLKRGISVCANCHVSIGILDNSNDKYLCILEYGNEISKLNGEYFYFALYKMHPDKDLSNIFTKELDYSNFEEEWRDVVKELSVCGFDGMNVYTYFMDVFNFGLGIHVDANAKSNIIKFNSIHSISQNYFDIINIYGICNNSITIDEINKISENYIVQDYIIQNYTNVVEDDLINLEYLKNNLRYDYFSNSYNYNSNSWLDKVISKSNGQSYNTGEVVSGETYEVCEYPTIIGFELKNEIFSKWKLINDCANYMSDDEGFDYDGDPVTDEITKFVYDKDKYNFELPFGSSPTIIKITDKRDMNETVEYFYCEEKLIYVRINGEDVSLYIYDKEVVAAREDDVQYYYNLDKNYDEYCRIGEELLIMANK